MSTRITGNPELLRNLWLEMTPQRLVAAPAILGLIALALFIGIDRAALGESLRLLGAVGFIATAAIWGARLAGQSQTEEFVAGTWDGQRISGLSPWDMVAGKLFGGASFAWYTGAWCLLVFLIGALGQLSLLDTLRMLIGMIAFAVLAQATSLLSVLIAWRKTRSVAVGRNRGMGLLILLLVIPNLLRLAPWLKSGTPSVDVLTWYGFEWPRTDFLLISLLLFTGWALLGAHRAMRGELQFCNRPWAWIAFLIFLQIYAAGWVSDGWLPKSVNLAGFTGLFGSISVVRLMIATCIAQTFAYVFIFTEPKDRLRLSRLIADWRARRYESALQATPLWLINGLITTVTAALMIAAGALSFGVHDLLALTAGTVALLLYTVRDFAVVLWCNLGPTQRRADAAAAVYLLVLYGLLPILLSVVGLKAFYGLVQPLSAFENPVWLLPAAIWAAAALDLLRRRWNDHAPAAHADRTV